MRLSQFILEEKAAILQAWEDFARSIEPRAGATGGSGLREHAALMLDTIVADLDTAQTSAEQARKSLGQGRRAPGESYAEIHAGERLRSGYTINQLVSEYRALRASVLDLWAGNRAAVLPTDQGDVTRFNEAIDQALAESVARFCAITTELADNSRSRLDAILQAAPVGIGLADRCGKIVMANAENRRIWGQHPQSASIDEYAEWKGWWADGSSRHGERLLAGDWALARALTGEEAPRDIVQIEPFGMPGVRRTILLHAVPIRDALHNVVGSVVAQMDITGQMQTEAALRESEAKFRTIADAMPQMVWSALPDGYHDYYNQQWYDFTGVPVNSTDGKGWNDMFHPDDQAGAWKLWRHSLATGDTYEVRYRLRHHSGQYRWTLGRALPVRDDAGAIIRWMGTCTDIHDQKLAEEKLLEAHRRKDEFLAMLAHELRNPLAPIASAAQLLRMPGIEAGQVHRSSDVILRQVKHMTELVDDLLDVSRVTRGLIVLENETLDLKLIVASAIEQVRPLIEARHHALQLRLAAGPVFVRGDRTRLVQVVANLLNNAAKYTPQKGHLALAMAVCDGRAELAVSDNGSGIAPTLLPYIFDLFTQGERTSDRAQGGLGLGLSLVKSITALHGGQVTARSPGLGAGSTFTVTLPVQAAPAQTPSGAPDGAAREAVARTVMIVDDNADAAEALSALLEMQGHRVSVQEDAMGALAAGERAAVDVFILDIGLPGMDGFELARRLRRDPASAGAMYIALTGYGQAQDRALSKAAGFDHHFVKPVDADQLAAVMARL
jgi:PAS domain S-box-containing protein